MAKLYRCQNKNWSPEGRPPCSLAMSNELVRIADEDVPLDSPPICPNAECGFHLAYVRSEREAGSGGGGGALTLLLVILSTVFALGTLGLVTYLVYPEVYVKLGILPGEDGGKTAADDPEGRPEIAAAPGRIQFGKTGIGGTLEKQLRITNEGASALEISEFRFNHPAFSTAADAAAVSIQPGESHDLNLVFSPTQSGSAEGALTLINNDPNASQLRVELTGEAAGDPYSVWHALEQTSSILNQPAP